MAFLRSTRGRKSRLLASVAALAVLVPIAMSSALIVSAGPALADGGHGGGLPSDQNPGLGGQGGAGGTGTAGQPGSPGVDGTFPGDGGGGGGGGGAGGGIGGTGGASGEGNAGGTAGNPGTAGSSGEASGGGGGGNGGANGQTTAGPVTNGSSINGGNGSNGGAGPDGIGGVFGGGGGGGGAGGYGLVVTGATGITNNSSITAGNGGNGGQGGTSLDIQGMGGGNGGDGGIGAQFTTPGATLINNGTIKGGNGGTGGQGGTGFTGGPGNDGPNGTNGLGGVGVTGASMTITNSGTIAGGTGSNGQANAITFTGGVNTLQLQAGSTITGNVVAFSTADTFQLGGTANGTFNASQLGSQYSGFGVFDKVGTSTWTLTGTPGTAIPWVISGGTLAAGASSNVFGSTSAITVTSPGTLDLAGFNQTIGSFTGSGTVKNSSATAATLTAGGTNASTAFSGSLIDGTGALGLTKTGTGTLTLSGNDTYSGATLVSGGTLAAGSTTAFSATSAFTVNATLDLGGFSSAIGSLAGSGTVKNSSATAVTLTAGDNNTSTAFSGGLIDGTGVLSLTKTGTGTLTLSGNDTYSGATLVSGGTLAAGSTTAFSATSTFIVNATLDLGGFSNTVGSLTGSGTVTNSSATAATLTAGGGNTSTAFLGNLIDGTGALGLTKAGTGTFTLSGNDTYSGATLVSGGTLAAGSATAFSATSAFTVNTTLDLAGFSNAIGSLAGSGTVKNSRAAAVTLTAGGDNTSTAFSGGLIDGIGALSLTKTGTGTLTLSGSNIYSGATLVSGGTLAAGSTTAFSATSAFTVNATLDLGGFSSSIGSLAGSGAVSNSSATAATLTSGGNNTSTVFSGGLTDGTGVLGLTKTGTGILTLSGSNTYSGTTLISGGTLALTGTGSLSNSSQVNVADTFDISATTAGATIKTLTGSGNVSLGSQTLTISNGSTTFSGDISGSGGLTLTSGTQILSGSNGYTGATNVNGGTLQVDGSIAGSTSVNVASGATLTGTGLVDPVLATTTIMSGGTFMPGTANTPGTSLTVGGNLALQSGALYVVSLNPATSSFANVTGSATLGGARVSALFANGSYVAKQYMILSAGSVSGTFGSVVNTNLPSGLHTTLSYDTTHAYLNLSLNFAPPPGQGLGGNQQGSGDSIINYFNTNGSIPLVFSGLTPAGLTQVSGETATGSQQTTFDAMSQFMGVMTDPFMNRGGGFNSAPGAAGYADEASAYAPTKKTDAFARFTKAPSVIVAQRWSVWAAGFGGWQSTDGNATAGTNTSTSSIYGTAVGADYLFSPNTIAGFALAGAGTGFSVANGGTGRSDLFQAGAYVRHTDGPVYISAALAYGWQDITTNRTVTVAGVDQLRAEFNANAWSGRLEGGYRFVSPWSGGVGITPYAAAQFVTFDLPAYAEQATSGTNNFALSYGAHDATDVRSELGIRTDRSFVMPDGILTLRGRAAWAHDYDPHRSIAATFQTLPGASFVVNGAAQAADSALTTASVEMKWTNNWSVAATFEDELSRVTNSYTGKGVLHYVW